MHRAVLDANVYVSAALRPTGPPGQVLARFLRDVAFTLILSPAIAAEVRRALQYPKVRRALGPTPDAASWFDDIELLADLVTRDRLATPACADPDDDKYLAAALDGRAGWVVTGDRALLALGEHEGVRIVTPRAFLDLLLEA